MAKGISKITVAAASVTCEAILNLACIHLILFTVICLSTRHNVTTASYLASILAFIRRYGLLGCSFFVRDCPGSAFRGAFAGCTPAGNMAGVCDADAGACPCSASLPCPLTSASVEVAEDDKAPP